MLAVQRLASDGRIRSDRCRCYACEGPTRVWDRAGPLVRPVGSTTHPPIHPSADPTSAHPVVRPVLIRWSDQSTTADPLVRPVPTSPVLNGPDPCRFARVRALSALDCRLQSAGGQSASIPIPPDAPVNTRHPPISPGQRRTTPDAHSAHPDGYPGRAPDRTGPPDNPIPPTSTPDHRTGSWSGGRSSGGAGGVGCSPGGGLGTV